MIQIYRSLGRDEDSKEAARKGIERAERELTLHPDNPRPAYLGAAALFNSVRATVPGNGCHARWRWILTILTQYNIACGYTALGDMDAAFDLLERLLPHANPEIKAWIKHDSDFDPLRDHPRYQKILELIG